MNDGRKWRCWAYVRVTGRILPSGMAAQMAALMDAAERMCLDVVGQSQEHSSGKTLDRMGLKEALRAVRLGYANAIYTYNVLQLSTDKLVLLRVLEILQDHHAVLICAGEDAYTALRGIGISQRLYQRSFCTGLGLPWLGNDKNTETNKNDSK